MVKYFVAYQAIDKNGKSAIGNIDVDMLRPISSMSDIRDAEKEIVKKYDFANVVITNYIKL